MKGRTVAAAFVGIGALIIFCGLAALSIPAALLILSGACLIAIGAFYVEVPA